MMVPMWNKGRITKLLQVSDHAVERAMVALYERQTLDEQQASTTKYVNHRGFRANHASKGSYYGRWVKMGRKLTGFHLTNARSIALHYAQQLADIANARAAEVTKAAEKHAV